MEAGADPIQIEDQDMVRVALAVDRREGSIWIRALEDQGISARFEREQPSLLSRLLPLWLFWPIRVGVVVSRADHERAHSYLVDKRYIWERR